LLFIIVGQLSIVGAYFSLNEKKGVGFDNSGLHSYHSPDIFFFGVAITT